MRLSITLIASVALAALLSVPAFAGPFTDVPTDHWAYEAIDMLQAEGIVEGYPDGTFKGNRSFTRYEMAMVVARLYTKLSHGGDAMPMGDYVTQDQFNEYKDVVEALVNEFQDELDRMQDDIDALSGRVDDLEDRVAALERVKRSIQWSGVMRMRVEDIVTGQSTGFNLTPFNPTLIPNPTVGQVGAPGPEFEEMLLIALEAQPSDYVHVYADLWQISSDLDTPVGDLRGAAPTSATSPPNQSLIIDQAYAVADINKLLGYGDELTPWLEQVYVTVGRQYNRFGVFGLTFDTGFEAKPGLFIDAGDPRWEMQLFLARDVNGVLSGQDGLGIARVAYGFGESRREDSDRRHFTEVGLNYLFTGVGDENGFGLDIDSELASGDWINNLKFEWYHADQDQFGVDVDLLGGTDEVEDSFILGLDVYNDGNLLVNVRGASIGLAPGYSSVDNNPFEEFDALANGLGAGGSTNFNFGYESGINYFPANFEGFGATVQYTWFEKFFMDLTFWDGQTKDFELDLPAIIRLNARYPLSESSDLGLEYIHAGIDSENTIAKLRGEYLVRF